MPQKRLPAPALKPRNEVLATRRRQVLEARALVRLERELTTLYKQVDQLAARNDGLRHRLAEQLANAAGFRLVEDPHE